VSDPFTKRGIPDEIWQARPYTPWERDDLAPVIAAYGSLGKAGLDFALRIAKQSSGYLIERFPPEGLGLESIYPEFRPDNAVKTGKRVLHWHGRGKPPMWFPASWVLTGKPKLDHLTRGGIWVRSENGVAIEVGTGKDPDDHGGINTQALHFHERGPNTCFRRPGALTRRGATTTTRHGTTTRGEVTSGSPPMSLKSTVAQGKPGTATNCTNIPGYLTSTRPAT